MKKETVKKNINLVVVLTIFILSTFGVQAKTLLKNFQSLSSLNEENSKVELYIAKSSLVVDLEQKDHIKLAIKARDIYASNKNLGVLTVKMYELDSDGYKTFISSQTLAANKKNKTRSVYLHIGEFERPSKDVQIEIFDTNNNLVNIYQAEIFAANTSNLQVSSTVNPMADANCAGDEFGECQLDYLMDKINFVAIPKRQAKTNIEKKADGSYQVSIPVPVKAFKLKDKKSKSKTKNVVNINDGFNDNFNYDGEKLYFVKDGQKKELAFKDGVDGDQNTTVQTAGDNISIDEQINNHIQNISETNVEEIHVSTFAYNIGSTIVENGAVSINPTHSLMRIESDLGTKVVSADPQILPGIDGQTIILKGTSDVNQVVLENNRGLSLVGGGSMILGARDNIMLIYDAVDGIWMELSRANN